MTWKVLKKSVDKGTDIEIESSDEEPKRKVKKKVKTKKIKTKKGSMAVEHHSLKKKGKRKQGNYPAQCVWTLFPVS